MNENEIAVDLRLQMDKLGQDAARAGKIVSKNLATGVKGLGETSVERDERLNSERSDREKRDRSIRNRKLDEADKLREMAKMEQQRRLFERNNPASGAGGGKRFPAATLLAGLGLGIPGIGSIAALAQMNPVAAGAVAAMRGLQFEVGVLTSTFKKASEQARQLYAKTLTSGFGTQFTAKRSLIAQTIGVGENEVFQFGAAVSVLNNRLQLASDTISKVNPVLTASAWNWKILGADVDALSAKFAYELAPAFNLLSRLLDGLVQTAIKNSDSILNFMAKFGLNLLVDNPVAKYGVAVINSAIEKAGGWRKAFGGADQAPPPVAFMKQMKASQWEHMGLIVGTGGGTNYQKNTADNTAKAVKWLEKIAQGSKMSVENVAQGMRYSLPSLP